MKAIITDASEVEINGTQSVTFNIVNDKGEVLVTSSLQDDVDQIQDTILARLTEYHAKCLSENKLSIGDEIKI